MQDSLRDLETISPLARAARLSASRRRAGRHIRVAHPSRTSESPPGRHSRPVHPLRAASRAAALASRRPAAPAGISPCEIPPFFQDIVLEIPARARNPSSREKVPRSRRATARRPHVALIGGGGGCAARPAGLRYVRGRGPAGRGGVTKGRDQRTRLRPRPRSESAADPRPPVRLNGPCTKNGGPSCEGPPTRCGDGLAGSGRQRSRCGAVARRPRCAR